MYLVYVVERRKWNAAARLLEGFGDLTQVGKVSVGWGEYREIWELEFEEYPAGLVTALRAATDTWEPAYHRIDEVLESNCPEIQAMLASPDPNTPSLSWCVRAFKERYAHWDTYWTAMGHCGTATSLFLRFCMHKGLITREEMMRGSVTEYFGDKANETPDFPRECHTVARIGNFMFDWTARQFPGIYGDNAPVPVFWVDRSDNPRVFKLQ